jgi:DNA-binding NarL/FixJ family response regulator
MSSGAGANETILIVDDEPAVRKTFEEWLDGADLGCRVLSAADAEAALQEANRESIDLAVLDWNLGAGNDGLQLLEDLFVFNPNIVAIMVTGYAHQATPLDAMRMGVRDYLDKNQDLNRETFLSAVRRQLERIRPAKRERRLHQSLVAFREAVEKVLPLVQSAAALTDPVPLPEAVRSLFRFLLQSTRASDGVLVTRSYDPERRPAEICRVYDSNGAALAVELVPFARSIAGTAVSLQQPSVMSRLQETAAAERLELQPFERDRQSLLAAPLAVAPGVHVVLELFDKRRPGGLSDPDGFTEADRQTVGAAAEVGAELLRQALAQRNVHQVLFSAIGAALEAGDSVSESLGRTAAQRLEQPPSAPVLDQLREGLRGAAETPADAEATLRLAEAIRVLTLRHGPPALHHCLRLVEDVRQLLDVVTG